MKKLVCLILLIATVVPILCGLAKADAPQSSVIPFKAYLLDEDGSFMQELIANKDSVRVELTHSVNNLKYYTLSRAYSDSRADMDSDEVYQLVVMSGSAYSGQEQTVILEDDGYKTWFSDNHGLTIQNKQLPLQMHGLLNMVNIKNAKAFNPHQIMEMLSSISRQFYLLSLLDHPNIVKPAFDPVESGGFPLMISPGKRYRKIVEEKHESLKNVILAMMDAASAMTYLHDQHIAHGDIKLESLFMKNDRIILGDFERFSLVNQSSGPKQLGRKKFTFTNNPFHAPEIRFPVQLGPRAFNTWEYTHASLEGDIWSFGMMLASAFYMTPEGHEMAKASRLNLPLYELAGLEGTDRPTNKYLESKPLDVYFGKNKPEVNLKKLTTREETVLKQLAQLIDRCTSTNPKERPDAAYVHATLQKIYSRYAGN